MFFFNSEQIPYASSDDLDRASDQSQQIFITESGNDSGWKGHGPGRSHDKVQNNDDIVVTGWRKS